MPFRSLFFFLRKVNDLFAQVNLVKCKANDKFYAIKKLNKAEMLTRQEVCHSLLRFEIRKDKKEKKVEKRN